jgi:hypothetical protein
MLSTSAASAWHLDEGGSSIPPLEIGCAMQVTAREFEIVAPIIAIILAIVGLALILWVGSKIR